MAELYGRCILDKASMMELRKEVHTEVLAQMREKGLTVEELAQFCKSCRIVRICGCFRRRFRKWFLRRRKQRRPGMTSGKPQGR